jgi:probable addiction module antidote protein
MAEIKKTRRTAKTSKFDAADYLKSPQAIAAYLSEAFETGDERFIAEALGTVARAKGMAGIANETGLSREGLYRSLSSAGRPELATTMKVLDALDMRLVVRPKEGKAA